MASQIDIQLRISGEITPLFGDELPTVGVYPQRIKTMWLLYGKNGGHICRGCKHLIRKGGSRRYYLKCDLTKITNGPGTDWRARWTSCGKYEDKKMDRKETKNEYDFEELWKIYCKDRGGEGTSFETSEDAKDIAEMFFYSGIGFERNTKEEK